MLFIYIDHSILVANLDQLRKYRYNLIMQEKILLNSILAIDINNSAENFKEF